MRVLHPEDLLQLPADRGQLRLSLFLPTARQEPGTSRNAARWERLVSGAKTAMRADGIPAARVREVCDTPWDLLTDAGPRVRFGDRFTLRPLFLLLSNKNHDAALAVYRALARDNRTLTAWAEVHAAERGRVDTLDEYRLPARQVGTAAEAVLPPERMPARVPLAATLHRSTHRDAPTTRVEAALS